MAELEGIKEIVNQVAVQAATAVMITLRDADAEPQPTTTASHTEPQRQRHSGLILKKPSWDAQECQTNEL